MARKKVSKWVMYSLGLLAALVLGGLFIKGTFTDNVILGYLPLMVHQVVGWAIIGVGAFWPIVKKH